jgi:glycine cleavage system aminomethyltransferase T
MSFEFLAPDAAVAFDGAMPALRSPVEWVHRDASASYSERAGWHLVADYGNPEAEAQACRRSVGVADVSHVGKLEIQGDADVVAGIVADLAGGARLELGRASQNDGVWWCPIAAERVMALTPPEATAGVRDGLEEAASGAAFVSVCELTTALGSNAVVGPLSRETFARSTALDMRPGAFAEGAFAPVSVARVPGMVLRAAGDSFVHLFGSGYANYVWTVFADAAEHLGGRAVGVDALPKEARFDA